MKKCKECGAEQANFYSFCIYPHCGGELEIVTKEVSDDLSKAIAWWNKLKIHRAESLCNKHYPNRHYSTLADREIEELWRKEAQQDEIYETDEYKEACRAEWENYDKEKPRVNFKMLNIFINNLESFDLDNHYNNLQLFFNTLATKPTFAKIAHIELNKLLNN